MNHNTMLFTGYKNHYEINKKHNFFKFSWKPYKYLVKEYFGLKPCVCVMAGSSADEQLDVLKMVPRENYVLIAIDQTHAKCIKEGFVPDITFTLDLFPFAEKGFWVQTEKTILVAPTVGNSDNIKAWKGELCLYKMIARVNNSVDAIFNGLQNNQYDDIGFQISSSTVGLHVLQFVRDIGARSFWIGLDFGVVDDKPFIDGYMERNKYDFKHDIVVTFKSGKKFKTTREWLMFSQMFCNFCKMYNYTLDYCSPKGLLAEDLNPVFAKHIRLSELTELAKEQENVRDKQ